MVLLETPATPHNSGSEVGMASNGTGFSGRSALTFVDDATDGSSPLGDVARLQLVRPVVDDSAAALVRAGAAMARVEREIDHLWRDSMQADDRAMSQRLAELSHALHRAAHRLGHDDAIG
jgi:hypothetical protein